jgi:hypothetical protein
MSEQLPAMIERTEIIACAQVLRTRRMGPDCAKIGAAQGEAALFFSS